MAFFPTKRLWTSKPNSLVPKTLGLGFRHAVLFNGIYGPVSIDGTSLIPTAAMLYDNDGAANFSGGDAFDSAVEIPDADILDGEITIIAELDVPTDFGSYGRYFIGDGNNGNSSLAIAFVSATVIRCYQANQERDITVPTMSGTVKVAVTRRALGTSWTHHVSVNGSAVSNGTTLSNNPNGIDRSIFIGRFGNPWALDLHYRNSIDFIAIKYAQSSDGELTALSENPYQIIQSRNQYITTAASGTTAGLTGTITASVTEADIVTGGKTSILTLTDDTFIAAGTGPIGTTAQSNALIAGAVSAQSETLGWNNEVTGVLVRTSDTVATITWSASASYDVTAQETVTHTIQAAVLTTSAIDVTVSPTFSVDFVAAAANVDVTLATITFTTYPVTITATPVAPATVAEVSNIALGIKLGL